MERLFEFARKATAKHDRAHDFEHAMEVLAHARWIVETEDIELDEYEGLLFPYVMIGHDFRDHKIKDALSEEEIFNFYKTEFVQTLTEISVEGQNDGSFPVGALEGIDNAADGFAKVVMHIHSNCSWSKRKTRQSCGDFERLLEILQDADWIEGMRLDRCIWYTEAAFPHLTEKEKHARVAEHIREKLLLIPAELNYQSSVKLVEELGYLTELTDYLRMVD